MNRKEFTNLVNEAKTAETQEKNYYFTEWQNFIEAWRHDRRVRWYLSKDAAICIIRYQAMYLNGDWDTEELANLQRFFKNIDIVD
jgi:hypothetical protein